MPEPKNRHKLVANTGPRGTRREIMTALYSFSLCSRPRRLFLILAANYVALATGRRLRQKPIINNGPTTVRELVAGPCPIDSNKQIINNGDVHIDVATIDEKYVDGEEDNCKHCVDAGPGTVTIGRIEPGVEIQMPNKSSVCVWRSSKDHNIKATRTCEAGDKEDPIDVKGSVHLDDRGRLLDGQNISLFASKCGASTNPKSVKPKDANDDGQRHSSTSQARAPKPTDAPAEGHGSEAPSPSASASSKHTAPTSSSDKARKSTTAPAEGNRSKARTPSASTENKAPTPSASTEHKAPTPSVSTEHKAPTPSASTEHKAPTPSASTEHKAPTPSASTEHKAPTPPASTEHKAPTPSASTEHKAPTPAASTEHKAPTSSASTEHKAPTPSASTEHKAPTPSASTEHKARTPSASTEHKAPIPSASTEHKAPTSNNKTRSSETKVDSTAKTKQEKGGHTNGKTKKKESAPAPGLCCS